MRTPYRPWRGEAPTYCPKVTFFCTLIITNCFKCVRMVHLQFFQLMILTKLLNDTGTLQLLLHSRHNHDQTQHPSRDVNIPRFCTSTQEVAGTSLTSTQLTSYSDNKQVLLLLIYAKHNVNGGLLYDNLFKR